MGNGHVTVAGNEVDQLFSILTTEFKGSDIPDVESLKSKILNAPMKPKPIVESMMFSWNWKDYIEPCLNPLGNHSFFNSFCFKKEDGEVKLRYKKLPQSAEYGPVGGMKLLKTRGNLEAIKAADFRVESLGLEKLLRGLQPYFASLDLETRMIVVTRWEALKKTLEALPLKREALARMDIQKLPKQASGQASRDDGTVEEDRQVQGTFFDVPVEEGDLEKDICTDMDVCVYTRVKRKRPWVGRVISIKDRETFVINWYMKDESSKCGRYIAMFNDNSTRYVSELDMEVVMFWAFTQGREEGPGNDSFLITPYWHDCLMKEYERKDCDD